MKTEQVYGRIKDIAEIFGMSRMTVYRHLDAIAKAGQYNKVVIDRGPRKKLIKITEFEKYLKSEHLKWLQA